MHASCRRLKAAILRLSARVVAWAAVSQRVTVLSGMVRCPVDSIYMEDGASFEEDVFILGVVGTPLVVLWTRC